MKPVRLRRSGLGWAATLAFMLAISEMIFMAGPFAFYFYGLFSPVLSFASHSPWLAWLPEFWVAHVAAPHAFRTTVEALGIVLATVGSISFIVHAAHLYWIKFVTHGIASRLLYAHVRHPQYTSLIVAGTGFALLWPRLANLALLCLMAGTYHALARDEEGRMTKLFGDGYVRTMGAKPAFVPGNPGGRLTRRLLGWAPAYMRATGGFILACTAVFLAALAIRAASIEALAPRTLATTPPLVLLIHANDPPPAVIEAAAKTLEAETEAAVGNLIGAGALDHLLIDAGVTRSSARTAARSAVGWTLVVARALRHGHSGLTPVKTVDEALALGTIRRITSMYAVAESGSGSVTRIDLPSEIYAHATAPVL